ncbi:MAG: Hpt domain-containing protein [Bacteroidota bacterium]
MNSSNGTLTYEYLDSDSLEMIFDLMDGDAEMIIDLVDTLTETTPDLLEELDAGVKSQNPSQIREAAHALKSSNAQLGALDFSELCRQMEEKGKREELEETDKLLDLIYKEFKKVEQALNSWKVKVEGQV